MRERYNLSMLTAFTSAPNHVRHPICKLLVRPRRAPKVNLAVRTQELNSLLFSNPPNPQRFRTWHSLPTVSFPVWEFYFNISEWHILSARAWTPALMLYLTNPCTKRKVLLLTKLKGNIYKTKSLRHYITCTASALWGAVSRTCSILLAAFLCNCFSLDIFIFPPITLF